MESHGKLTKWLPHFWHMYMFSAFTYIIIVHCQTQFVLLFSIWTVLNSHCYVKVWLFDIHSIEQSWKDMENRRKWSWKVLENAHKKVLESYGKPFSVFCMHPVYAACCAETSSPARSCCCLNTHSIIHTRTLAHTRARRYNGQVNPS